MSGEGTKTIHIYKDFFGGKKKSIPLSHFFLFVFFEIFKYFKLPLTSIKLLYWYTEQAMTAFICYFYSIPHFLGFNSW